MNKDALCDGMWRAPDIEDRKQAEERTSSTKSLYCGKKSDQDVQVWRRSFGTSPLYKPVLFLCCRRSIVLIPRFNPRRDRLRELVTRRHRRSDAARAHSLDVPLAAQAIPDLIASELFGHEEGVFHRRDFRAALGPVALANGGNDFWTKSEKNFQPRTQIRFLLRFWPEHEFEARAANRRHPS